MTLRGAMPRETIARQPLCADIDGFSLHAAVRVEAHERKRLEQLCRYITRPALSDERVQLIAAGQAELKLKTPWRDSTTHLVMPPLEFKQPIHRPLSGGQIHGRDVSRGCAPCKGGAFQRVQAPPGNRSSRKQPEQSWR